MENNINNYSQKKKKPFLTIALATIIILIVILLGVIVYIAYQYSTNQDLRDVAEQLEVNANQPERTYEEKVKYGEIILTDE